MKHPAEDDNMVRSIYEPISMQEPDDPRLRRIAVAAGAALVVGVGGVLGFNSLASGESAPAPHELHVEGAIAMDSISQQVAEKIAAGTANVIEDGAGSKVVTLSEYMASPGTKATGNRADLVGVALSPVTTPALQKQLDKVIAADADTLNAVVGNASLGSIRFNIVIDPNDKNLQDLPNGNMLVTPAKVDETGKRIPAIIDYTLPAKGSVSMNSMAGMIGHEQTHIEQRLIDAIDKTDDEAEVEAMGTETYVDTEAYRKDLSEIREASIAAAEADPTVIAAAEAVITTSKDTHDPAAEARVKVAQAILDHKFNDMQPTSEKPSKLHDFNIDEGRVSEPDFVYAFDSDLTDEQLAQATPEQKQAMQDLTIAFDKSLYENPESPLSVLDESSYIEGGSYYGHPGANTAELIGSAENVLRSYPQRMVEKMKHLPGKLKGTIVRLLDRINSDTDRSIFHTGYGYSDAAQQLHDKTNATLDWVKSEINNPE